MNIRYKIVDQHGNTVKQCNSLSTAIDWMQKEYATWWKEGLSCPHDYQIMREVLYCQQCSHEIIGEVFWFGDDPICIDCDDKNLKAVGKTGHFIKEAEQ